MGDNLFSAGDRVFLGEGLFETIRFERQHPKYASLHWRRIRDSSNYLGIPFTLSADEWYEQLMHHIRLANVEEGGLKVLLSAGSAARGLDSQAHTSKLLFEAFHYEPSIEPLSLISALWQRDAKNPIYQLKSVNYLEAILARRYAKMQGVDDALFFNNNRFATETTVANLFIIKKNQLCTPSIDNGVLPGIIRGRVLELSINLGITCIEASIDVPSIMEADAVFVTNTLYGIRSVRSLDGRSLSMLHPIIDSLKTALDNDIA